MLIIQVNRNGRTATYWKIRKIFIDIPEREISFEVRGYATLDDSRDANYGANLHVFKFPITGNVSQLPAAMQDEIRTLGGITIDICERALMLTSRYHVNWSQATQQ